MTCGGPRQHSQPAVKKGRSSFPMHLPCCGFLGPFGTTSPPAQHVVVMATLMPLALAAQGSAPTHFPEGHLWMAPSTLHLDCKATEHLFLWKVVNSLPPSIIRDLTIELIHSLASQASLHDTSNYGVGLHKFHLFCDIFSIPEESRLPASFSVLHSFALWVMAEPDTIGQPFASHMPLEPVSVSTAHKYLAAIL